MEIERHIFRKYTGSHLTKETVTVKIKATDDEMIQFVIGGISTISILGKSADIFNSELDFYKNLGYEVLHKDREKLTFEVQKT